MDASRSEGVALVSASPAADAPTLTTEQAAICLDGYAHGVAPMVLYRHLWPEAPRPAFSVFQRLYVDLVVAFMRGARGQIATALPPSLQRCQEALETARDVLVDKLADDKPATIAQGIAAVCKELRALHELGLRETAALVSWIGSDWAGLNRDDDGATVRYSVKPSA